MYETFYYLAILFSACTYFISLRIFRLRLVSYSTLMYVLAFLFIMLHGYEIASGNAIRPALSRGFDIEIYFLYLSYVVLLPLGLIAGNFYGKSFRVECHDRKNTKFRVYSVLLFIVIYALLYFCWLPYIPVNSILTGSGDIGALAIERINITHQLGLHNTIPFPFRYWRNFLQPVFLIIFAYLLLSSQNKPLFHKIFLFFVFLFLVYCSVFTLEKAPMVYIIIALMMVALIKKGNLRLSKILGYVVLLIIIMIIMYHFFMGAKAETFTQPFSIIWDRISRQSVSTYIQIEYVRDHGFLLFKGIDLPILKHFIDYGYTNPSKWAYEILMPAYANAGAVGAAGGMSLAQLYFCFSWFSIPIFFLFVCAYGFFDSLFLNSIYSERSSMTARKIHMAFYVGLSSYYSMALASSVFLLFAFPTVFNPSVFFFLLLYMYLMNIAKLKVYRKRRRNRGSTLLPSRLSLQRGA